MDEVPATVTAPPPARTIGERLRAGRERAGLSVAAAAEKLHLDNKVIEALEADRFADLGASVYIRGHLKRYGEFVGEKGDELVASYSSGARAALPPPPDLTQVPKGERRSDPKRLVTPLAGLGAVVVLAGAIWLVSSHKAPKAAKSDVATDVPAASTLAQPPSGATTPASAVATPVVAQAPAVAPATGTAAVVAAPAARDTQLKLELTTDSWVEVYDARGQRLYYDVASAGSVQSVSGRGPLRVILGNAGGVAVQVDGQSRPIPSNALEGEGARFVVNRSGSLTRARP